MTSHLLPTSVLHRLVTGFVLGLHAPYGMVGGEKLECSSHRLAVRGLRDEERTAPAWLLLLAAVVDGGRHRGGGGDGGGGERGGVEDVVDHLVIDVTLGSVFVSRELQL